MIGEITYPLRYRIRAAGGHSELSQQVWWFDAGQEDIARRITRMVLANAIVRAIMEIIDRCDEAGEPLTPTQQELAMRQGMAEYLAAAADLRPRHRHDDEEQADDDEEQADDDEEQADSGS